MMTLFQYVIIVLMVVMIIIGVSILAAINNISKNLDVPLITNYIKLSKSDPLDDRMIDPYVEAWEGNPIDKRIATVKES